MTEFTQESRLISIESPLPKDELLIVAFQGSEHISQLFEFRIVVLSSNLALTPDKLIGEKVTVTIQNEIVRTFNGYVSQFSFGEITSDNLREYKLTVVPWLWFLSRTHNNRIFQNKTIKDIISQVFDDLGFSDYEFSVKGANKPREYCVQYDESDLNFVSRLLEEEGIAYYFKQDGKKHTLKIVDQKSAYEDCPESEATYSKGNKPGAQINHWQRSYSFIKGGWVINDYNFKEPSKSLLAQEPVGTNFKSASKFKHYEYADIYDYPSGKEIVSFRSDAEEATMDTIRAGSDLCTFYAGGKFKLSEHESKSENGGYLITSIHHDAFDDSYYSGSHGDTGYSNTFTCIPDKVQYRPQRNHRKPVMRGPQSAVVTGPSGEEIFIDEFGRIKVQFIWDREGKKDENTTCFLRVRQDWAGNQWGSSFIPRIGHEVIVDFLDGDPDRPLVTGSVYNGTNKPPYPSKTQSGIKTRSTKGAGASNYNELRFEDKKGSEQIFVQAEKDYDIEIKNNQSLTIGNDRTKSITGNENSSIDKDRNKTVSANQSESIGKNKSIDVGKNHVESIGKDKTVDVGGNHTESISKNMSISITGDLSESVTGMYTEDVTKDYMLKAKTITLEAGEQITIKTGSAKIVMKSDGDIMIDGNNIQLKGGGNINVKGGGDVGVKAGGNAVIKGSKTAIN